MPAAARLLPPEPSADPLQPSLPAPSPSIQLTPLLGGPQSEHEQVLHSLYAAQAATLVWSVGAADGMEHNRRDVIVGIALEKAAEDAEGPQSTRERRIFFGVMKMLRDVLTQS